MRIFFVCLHSLIWRLSDFFFGEFSVFPLLLLFLDSRLAIFLLLIICLNYVEALSARECWKWLDYLLIFTYCCSFYLKSITGLLKLKGVIAHTIFMHIILLIDLWYVCWSIEFNALFLNLIGRDCKRLTTLYFKT